MTHPHTQLIEDTLALIGGRKDCRVWQNQTGAYKTRDRWIRYGKLYSPDIIGFCSDGVFLGIEGKTGNAVKSKGQENFHAVALRYQCRMLTIYDAREAEAFLDSLNLPKIDLTPEFFR